MKGNSQVVFGGKDYGSFGRIEINSKMGKMAEKVMDGKVSYDDYKKMMIKIDEQWEKEISLPTPNKTDI